MWVMGAGVSQCVRAWHLILVPIWKTSGNDWPLKRPLLVTCSKGDNGVTEGVKTRINVTNRNSKFRLAMFSLTLLGYLKNTNSSFFPSPSKKMSPAHDDAVRWELFTLWAKKELILCSPGGVNCYCHIIQFHTGLRCCFDNCQIC